MERTYGVLRQADPVSANVQMRKMEHLIIDADLADVELWVGPGSQPLAQVS